MSLQYLEGNHFSLNWVAAGSEKKPLTNKSVTAAQGLFTLLTHVNLVVKQVSLDVKSMRVTFSFLPFRFGIIYGHAYYLSLIVIISKLK